MASSSDSCQTDRTALTLLSHRQQNSNLWVKTQNNFLVISTVQATVDGQHLCVAACFMIRLQLARMTGGGSRCVHRRAEMA